MPAKKKKGGAKASAKPNSPDDDDWEALNEAVAEAASTRPPPPSPAKDTEAAQLEMPPSPGGNNGEPAPVEDAAAAFLASVGESGSGAAKKKENKKKDKKRGKKKEDEEDDKPQSKQGRLILERQAAHKAEQERIRKAKEEQERKIREEEEARLKAEREEEERRQAKLQRRAEKRAEAKAKGTYETKKQKGARLANERRLKALQDAGMLPVSKVLDRNDKPQESSQEQPDVRAEEEAKEEEQAPKEEEVEPKEEEALLAEEEEDEGKDAPPAEDEQTQALASTEHEEDEPPASGELDDAVDDWEAGDLSESLAMLAEKSRQDEEEEVDEAEQEAEAERERLRLAGLALREREEKKKAEAEERARLEALAQEQADSAKREAELRKLAARERRLKREEEAEAARSSDILRSPICCIMGHVDTGKTKLLDKIRQTNVQDGEAGGITQQIGATFFNKPTLLEKIEPVRAYLKDEHGANPKLPPSAIDSVLAADDALDGVIDPEVSALKLPGLLVIDTPGHESFSNLRSRGSSLCDMAIVVVDLMHGLEQQTLQSISMLRRKRTPFVVALNKIDRCYDWQACENECVRRTLSKQQDHTKQEFRTRLEQCTRELNEQGLNVTLYWNNEDPGSTVSMVPTSAITGEGVPDLLRVILSLTQHRLTSALMLSSTLQCTVLEVKVVEGLGSTLDVILVNGTLHEGDTMVLCTQDGPIVTQARALFTPPPSRETRVKSELVKHDSVQAAIGLKITGQDLEKVVPGTSLRVCGPDDDLEDLKEEAMKDVSFLVDTLVTESKGVSVQASTLGALEALLEFLRNPGKDRNGKERNPIPVFAASVGPIFKKDIIRAALMGQKGHEEYACILGFDVAVDPEAQAHADKLGVRVFTANIIYHLEEEFKRHLDGAMERKRQDASAIAVFPCVVKIIPKHVFNAKDPIVVGVEVIDGIVKVGTPLCIPHNGFLDVGVVQSIQSNHKEVERVKKGGECAIKIVNESNPNITFGRQFDATHALYSKLSRESIDALKAYFKDDLGNDDWHLVKKLKKVRDTALSLAHNILTGIFDYRPTSTPDSELN